MYGFHKQRHANSQNYFKHQQFRKGQILLAEIKRKPQRKKLNNENNVQNNDQSEVDDNILSSHSVQQRQHRDEEIIQFSQALIKQNQILLRVNQIARKATLDFKTLKIQELKLQILSEQISDIKYQKNILIKKLAESLNLQWQNINSVISIEQPDN